MRHAAASSNRRFAARTDACPWQGKARGTGDTRAQPCPLDNSTTKKEEEQAGLSTLRPSALRAPGLKASTVPRRRSESVSNCAVWLSIGGCHVLRKASLTRCDQQESDWRFARRQRMCLASRGTPNLTLSAAPFRRASTSCTKPPSSPQGSRFEWQKRKSVSCRWNRRAQ